MVILLYVMGHLKEMFTADDGSDKFADPDEEGDILETVPVPQISAGDAVMCSDLTSMFDVCCPLVVLLLPVVKVLKFFLT